MTISNVVFDSGPTEVHIDLVLANLGPPTTVEGWELTVSRGSNILWNRQPPRVTFSLTYNMETGRAKPPDDISKRPLVTGEKLPAHFTWTFPGNAKEVFDRPATVFRLSAVDIRGRDIVAHYVIP